MYQSPHSAFHHLWLPHQGTWTCRPSVSLQRTLACVSEETLYLDLVSDNFHCRSVARNWEPIQCTLKTRLRRCKQNKISGLKQRFHPAASNSDTSTRHQQNLKKICWSIPCLHPSWKVHTYIEICASLNHGKKTKADGSGLIPRKHTETLVLLSVCFKWSVITTYYQNKWQCISKSRKMRNRMFSIAYFPGNSL